MSDFTDSWTPEQWRKALRASEDINARNVLRILHLVSEIERIGALAMARPFQAANEARQIAYAERVTMVQDMTAQRKSIARIHLDTGISTRTISRLRKAKV